MQITRFFAGSLVALSVVLSSACSADPPPAPQVEATPIALGDAVIDPPGVILKSGQWRCSEELHPISVPVHKMGGPMIHISAEPLAIMIAMYETDAADPNTAIIRFSGQPFPSVQGVYVVTKGNPFTTFSTVWKPGMEKALSVSPKRFFNKEVVEIVLCTP